MLAFDAPSREECTAIRAVSNTPQQALTLMNDPSYVEAARAFAVRLIREGGRRPEERVATALMLALSREPRADETDLLVSLYHRHARDFERDPASAEEMLSIGLWEAPKNIDTIELADLKYADELGYAVKLLATTRLVDGQLEMHTQPTLIRHHRPLAEVDGAYNMVAVTGDTVGQTWFSGMGAGQTATASAVVSDLIDVAVGRAQLTFPQLDVWGGHDPFRLQPAAEIFRRYYLRFNVEDKPHVMADITDVVGRNEISLASVIQHEAPELDDLGEGVGGAPIVPLVIMTHRTREGRVQSALSELAQLTTLRPPLVCMPVSD